MWVHSLAAVKVLLKLYIILHVVAYSELSIGHLQQVHNQVHLPWWGGGVLTMDVCNLQVLRGFLTEYFSRFTIAVCKEFTVMLSQ